MVHQFKIEKIFELLYFIYEYVFMAVFDKLKNLNKKEKIILVVFILDSPLHVFSVLYQLSRTTFPFSELHIKILDFIYSLQMEKIFFF